MSTGAVTSLIATAQRIKAQRRSRGALRSLACFNIIDIAVRTVAGQVAASTACQGRRDQLHIMAHHATPVMRKAARFHTDKAGQQRSKERATQPCAATP